MERKGVGIPPSEGEAVQRLLGHYTGQFFLVFAFLQANYLASFSIPDLPWDPPLGVHTPLSQDGSRSQGLWHKQASCGLELSPDF